MRREEQRREETGAEETRGEERRAEKSRSEKRREEREEVANEISESSSPLSKFNPCISTCFVFKKIFFKNHECLSDRGADE